jgi:hypothetical protein
LVLHYLFNENGGGVAQDTTNPVGGAFSASAISVMARGAGKFGTSWYNSRATGDQNITVNRVLNFNTYTFCWWSKVNDTTGSNPRVITPTDTN